MPFDAEAPAELTPFAKSLLAARLANLSADPAPSLSREGGTWMDTATGRRWFPNSHFGTAETRGER